MNVIVSNKYHDMLQSLSIDVIKSIDGEFEVDEIISTFKNFFFQRMILDITAIKDYKNINNLQKLSISLDMDKVIFLLDNGEDTTNSAFLSQLISLGIYNFTRNVEGIMYLYNNPNSYKDVAQFHELNTRPTSNSSILKNPVQGPIITSVNSNNNLFESNVSSKNARIIGIKNVTKQSGATTLTYLMKKELERNYNVAAIEINKRDFMYFPDRSLISATKDNISNFIDQNKSKDIILIDLNDDGYTEQLCNEVIYLIEPSVIKLNKLMIINSGILKTLSNKKVILNQSMLSNKDVLDFEYESKLKIFYNMPALDDREANNGALNAFLSKLGFGKSENGEIEERKKILGIF